MTASTVRSHCSSSSLARGPSASATSATDDAPSFAALALCEELLRALRETGYLAPTPIQSQAIPPLLAGRDLLGCAQTGTGKTAAFALPILHRLMASPRRGRSPRALILAPTRELALQIAGSFATYGRHTPISGTTVFGGVSQAHQAQALRRGVDVVVATPGRLIDLLGQGVIDLSAVEIFVLDEADRMLDMGFIQPIRRIAGALPPARQTLLFSATMPGEIRRLAESLLRDPVCATVAPVASVAPRIEQSVHLVVRHDKAALLHRLLRDSSVRRAIVFVRTKRGADRLSRHLDQRGIRAGAIHGNKAQNARQRALEAFRSGRVPVLVATDVAARGIDVDDVTHVFNFDLPLEPEAYVHRIGRTGRAGAIGRAVAFCDAEERGLLRAIESLLGQPIARAVGSDPSLEGSDRHDEAADRRRSQGGRPGPRGGRPMSQAAPDGSRADGGGAPGAPPPTRSHHRSLSRPGAAPQATSEPHRSAGAARIRGWNRPRQRT